jgi:CMP/dCMP kinase
MIVKGTPKRPHELGLLIVVGGPGKSGSSTISKLLASHFKLRRIYGGEIMRKYAAQHNMDIETFFEYIEKEGRGKEFDQKVDSYLLKQAYQKDVLIESKVFAALAPKFQIPTTVTIWIDCPTEVRAMRTFMKVGKSVSKDSPEFIEEVDRLTRRYELDKRRYKESYGIDYTNPKLYNDIVIDSSRLNERDTLSLILKYIKDGGYLGTK